MTMARKPAAFTLVEVLVVIAIIGILVAISLPAINSAREAARRSSCANNLSQLATAINVHEEAHKTFPTGGWGASWVGDPDAGFGTKQPGGWIYNVLPFIEEKTLRELGKGLPAAAKRAAMVEVLQSPVPIFNCPSRRLPRVYPYKGASSLQNCDPPANVAKSDYAISATVSYLKSEVIASDIQHGKGFSKTVLVGEKSLGQVDYQTGAGGGDTLTMYIGDCDDIRRSASGTPSVDEEGGGSGFGGPHSGCNIAMCDGAVRFVISTENLQP
jgi:prepilin-type N-terminal cleavage/methylation domain-containing protein